MRRRGQGERRRDVWCVDTGEKLIRPKFEKSLSKVTLWRRTKELGMAADALEEASTKRLPYTTTFP